MTAPSNANTSGLDLVEHLKLALVIANTSIRDQERRAAAAEARADRLAKVLARAVGTYTGIAERHRPSWEPEARAALQQETQK